MSASKMHLDEVDTDALLVRRLLASQFPQWANLFIERVHSAGTDNALYRLGEDMVVRLPRVLGATGQVTKEHEWLPRLAPFLPLPIPAPLAKGTPGDGYPWCWSVYRWIKGESATLERLADPAMAAEELAHFVAALHRIDPIGGPPPGSDNSFRGVPLAARDAATRVAISALRGTVDAAAANAAWDAALNAPAWHDSPVWIRRGWALSVGLIALAYYQTTNPVLARISRYAIDEVLAAN